MRKSRCYHVHSFALLLEWSALARSSRPTFLVCATDLLPIWSEHQHSIFFCEELAQSYLNPWNLTNWYPFCAWFQKLYRLHYCVSVMELVFLTSQCPSFSWDICMTALIGISFKFDFLAPSYQYSTLPLTRVWVSTFAVNLDNYRVNFSISVAAAAAFRIGVFMVRMISVSGERQNWSGSRPKSNS